MPAANGGIAGEGGDVDVTNRVDVTTSGTESHGMFVQSRAGFGGTGGNGYILSDAGSGGPAAQGGTASATNYADIATLGEGAIGIFAQSIGGGGGNGGAATASWVTRGSGKRRWPWRHGHRDQLRHGSTGSIALGTGQAAHGVFAQSVGGAAATRATRTAAFVAWAATAARAATARATATNNGRRDRSSRAASTRVGLYAQSIGGGGGDGGSDAGIAGIGGTGGGGGDGGDGDG